MSNRPLRTLIVLAGLCLATGCEDTEKLKALQLKADDEIARVKREADEKIKKLYDMVKDTKIRSMDDATKIKDAFSEVLKPLKKSVDSMKKVDKKKYAVELGLTVTGEFTNTGRQPPPVAGFGLKVTF